MGRWLQRRSKSTNRAKDGRGQGKAVTVLGRGTRVQKRKKTRTGKRCRWQRMKSDIRYGLKGQRRARTVGCGLRSSVESNVIRKEETRRSLAGHATDELQADNDKPALTRHGTPSAVYSSQTSCLLLNQAAVHSHVLLCAPFFSSLEDWNCDRCHVLRCRARPHPETRVLYTTPTARVSVLRSHPSAAVSRPLAALLFVRVPLARASAIQHANPIHLLRPQSAIPAFPIGCQKSFRFFRLQRNPGRAAAMSLLEQLRPASARVPSSVCCRIPGFGEY